MVKSNDRKGKQKGAHARSQGTPSPDKPPNTANITGNNLDVTDKNPTPTNDQNMQDTQFMAEVTDGTGLMDIERTERNGPEGNVGAVG
jgi:hypothetical protein